MELQFILMEVTRSDAIEGPFRVTYSEIDGGSFQEEMYSEMLQRIMHSSHLRFTIFVAFKKNVFQI